MAEMKTKVGRPMHRVSVDSEGLDMLFESEKVKERLRPCTKLVNFVMTFEEFYKYYHMRDYIYCLTLHEKVSRPIFTLANWKVLQCLTIIVEANIIHLPEMLQHLDIFFSDGINVDNLKAIEKLKKLEFLKIHTNLSTGKGGFGLALRTLGCEVRNVLKSVALFNLSKTYVSPDDIGYLLSVNPSIESLSITMEESSECFNLFTKSFTFYLSSHIIDYLSVSGVKMFSSSSFGLYPSPFLTLLHLYVHNSNYLADDQFNCLIDRAPTLHFLSIKCTKVNLESLGLLLVLHQNLVRLTLFIEDYVTCFPDNLKFKLDMLRYVLCFKPWQFENICLCQYFADETIENLRSDLAGCIAKSKPVNVTEGEVQDPMSCSVEKLKELVFDYIYKDGHTPCDEASNCVGIDCQIYSSDNLKCACDPVDRKHKH